MESPAFERMPPSQGDTAICFAYATAGMISRRVGFEVSPLDVATTFFFSRPAGCGRRAGPRSRSTSGRIRGGLRDARLGPEPGRHRAGRRTRRDVRMSTSWRAARRTRRRCSPTSRACARAPTCPRTTASSRTAGACSGCGGRAFGAAPNQCPRAVAGAPGEGPRADRRRLQRALAGLRRRALPKGREPGAAAAGLVPLAQDQEAFLAMEITPQLRARQAKMIAMVDYALATAISGHRLQLLHPAAAGGRRSRPVR